MALNSSTSMYMFAFMIIVVVVVQQLCGQKNQHSRRPQATESKITPTRDTAGQVTPLLNFDFAKEPPIPYRPFKSGLHVAMGIKKIQKDDWIIMDRGYLERLDERITTMEGNPQSTIGVNDVSAPAIIELFREVMIEHVPKRFPTMFQVNGQTFTNLVTKKTYDLQKALQDPVIALQTMSENVEEDFYLMCPDGNGEFRLQGFIACFPGGFDGPSRIGMSFRDIHGPVPLYEERIAKGVDKFVNRMKAGDMIERFNWSLQTDGMDLFRLDGNNYYPEKGQTLPDEPLPIDIDQCWLRCERQSLLVLKETKAIIFTVRAYMTSLQDIVKEGNGVQLADAIDSMPEKLGYYKMRPFWERDVMKFLRQQV